MFARLGVRHAARVSVFQQLFCSDYHPWEGRPGHDEELKNAV
jgi:hypothetical protein